MPPHLHVLIAQIGLEKNADHTDEINRTLHGTNCDIKTQIQKRM